MKETWHVFERLSAYEALMSMWAHTILFAHQISKPHFMGVISHLWSRFTWMAARPADFHKGKALVCPEEEHPILKLRYSIRQAFYVSHLPRSTSTTNQGRAPEEKWLRWMNSTALDKNSGSRPTLNTSSCDCWQRPHLLHSCNLENPCICGLCRTKGPFRDETRRLNMLNI